MAASVIEVLRSSGPISVADLSDRVASSMPELVLELEGLEREGLVDLTGSRGTPAEMTVELSGRGLKYIMSA